MKLPDLQDKAEFDRIGRMPSNRIYKYIALVFAITGTILMLLMGNGFATGLTKSSHK